MVVWMQKQVETEAGLGAEGGWAQAQPALIALVQALSPREMVGLGLARESGGAAAYFSLCAAGAALPAFSAFGIGLWEASGQAPGLPAQVPVELRLRNQPWQAQSRLIAADPRASAAIFEPGSLDLLLLAPSEAERGAAEHWLAAWAGRLAPQGLVLLDPAQLAAPLQTPLPGGLVAYDYAGLWLLAARPLSASLRGLGLTSVRPPGESAAGKPADASGQPRGERPDPARKDPIGDDPSGGDSSWGNGGLQGAVACDPEADRARIVPLAAQGGAAAAADGVELVALKAALQAAEAESEVLRGALATATRHAAAQQSALEALQRRVSAQETAHEAELMLLTTAAAAAQEGQLAQRSALAEALKALEDSRRIRAAQDQRLAELLAESIRSEGRSAAALEAQGRHLAQEHQAREIVEAAHAALEVRLAALYASTSWRMTGPLRRVIRLLRPRR